MKMVPPSVIYRAPSLHYKIRALTLLSELHRYRKKRGEILRFMESNRKRTGFMKGKLMPFNRAAKPSPTSRQYTSMGTASSTVKASQTSPNAAAYSVGFMDYVIAAQPNQKVSFIVPAADHSQLKQQYDHKHYGAVAAGDESVDMKAATYISSVQERFKLEISS